MEFDLAATVALLSRTPAALDAMLRDLPPSWTQATEGDGTWSVYDVLGHLIHGERTDWIPRARMVLEYGDSRTFEPFDRFAQQRESEGKTLAQLLDEFASARAESLTALSGLQLSDQLLARTGRHPRLGVVTLRELLAAWTVHDLTHLHQISRIMAFQYRDAVGPWKAYLGVLHCSAHGA